MSKMIPPVGVAMACGRTRAWEKKMHVNPHKGNTKIVKKSNTGSYHSLTTMTSESSSKIVFLNLHISRSTQTTPVQHIFKF